ncbi:MAG: hypothetical protein WEB53_16955 [Akkermansiaceae bacterium]
MSEPNPYAPPSVDESEAPSAIYWQCYGERVMARNGAMLPKVDLETGASDEEMTSVARSYQAAGAGHVFKIAIFVGIYFFARESFEGDFEWMLWTVVGASILVRETFHFSEAFEIPEADLSDPLQQKIQSWRASHPDWPLIQADRLPSPAGDLTVESATLVSPGFEHSIHFIHTWLEQKSSTSTCMFEFHTFIKPGRKIYTTHMPLIKLPRPHVDAARVKGSEEEVFRAHLTRCASHEIDAPADRAELLERIHREKLEIDALLEAAGYHGPTREIG